MEDSTPKEKMIIVSVIVFLLIIMVLSGIKVFSMDLDQEQGNINLSQHSFPIGSVLEVPNNTVSLDLSFSDLQCPLMPLAQLPNLRKLDLHMCEEVPYLEDLAQSKSLEELNLLGVYVDDISFLSAISTLRKIIIGNETNYYSLLAIKSLEEIVMSEIHNEEFKESIKTELPNLKNLTFR